jgi:hypothetical protein
MAPPRSTPLPSLPDGIAYAQSGRLLLLAAGALERWWRRGRGAWGGWSRRLARYEAWRGGAPLGALLDLVVEMGLDGSIGSVDDIVDVEASLRTLLTGASPLPEPPEALAWLRWAASGAGARGGHDTPRVVAARLVAALGEEGGEGLWRGPVLEPAVGGGALLRAWLEAAGRREGAARPVDLVSSLYGVDLDPLAVAAARLTLLDACFPQLAPDAPALAQIIRADPLGGDGVLPSAWPPRFAAVLANPPWASASGRHAATWARAAIARSRAPDSDGTAGWPGVHTTFSEAILPRLAADGVAGLILPSQVTDLDGYGSFRRGLAERVRRVERLGEGVFPGVTSPVALLILGPASERPLRLLEEDAPARELPRAALRARPDAAWRPPVVGHGDGWPAGFRARPGVFGDIGVHTGNAARRLIHDGPGPDLEPVLEGGDLLPFGHLPPSRYLWAGLRAAPGERFRVPPCPLERARILIRQTASRPVACPGPGLRFRNSVLASPGVEGLPDALVLAILNSEVAAGIHRALAPDAGQRAFPQVKVGHLARFPWPEPALARGVAGDVVGIVEELVGVMAAWRDDLEAWLDEVSAVASLSARQRRRWGALGLGRLPLAAGIPPQSVARLEERRRAVREEIAPRGAGLEEIISRLYGPVVAVLR